MCTAPKRSDSARLPQKVQVHSSKTMKFCETSSIFALENVKNEAILEEFCQKWIVECRTDGLVPMRFAIFPVHVEKVHAAMARSAFGGKNGEDTATSEHWWKLRWSKSARARSTVQSQNSVQSTPFLEHFWKLRCQKVHAGALYTTLYTLYFRLDTVHYTLYTPYTTLDTLHFTLCTLRFTLDTPGHSTTLYTLHSTLYTLHFSLLRYT